MKKNNWTQQLRESVKGIPITIDSIFYDSVLTTRKRMEERKEGTWFTCKNGDTFTIKRTS